jgi:cytoskeletal protein RodZ
MTKSSYSQKQRTDDSMSLATIGQKLRSAREAQGLTLVQVYERTKIPLNHLQSVEQGDSDELPEPVFIFGFIKRYAECIGLDGQVLADEYKMQMGAGNGKKNQNQAASTPYYASNEYIAKSKVKISTPTYKLWLFNSIIIVGVVGTITWFINSQQNQMANQTDPSLNGLRNATRGLAPVAPQPNQPAQPAAQTPAAAPVVSNRLTLSATRHVWVEVKRMSNGDSVFTGYLEQGDRRDFEDPQGLFVRAGDGGSLSVDWQGKIESFGLNGKVSDRQFVSAAGAAGTVTPGAPTTPVTGSGTITSAGSTPRPVTRRIRRQSSNTEAARPRKVEPRRYDAAPREAPARYSEGRLDND